MPRRGQRKWTMGVESVNATDYLLATEAGDTAPDAPSGEFGTLFERVLSLMQEAKWPEADAALMALQARYPGSAEVAGARERLTLHLSAEESWSRGMERRTRAWGVALRALLVANLLLYLLLAVAWLLATYAGVQY